MLNHSKTLYTTYINYYICIVIKSLKQIMNRLTKIKEEIGTTSRAYKFKETAKEVIKFYADNIDRVNALPEKTFNSYSFLSEVLRKCEDKEKLSKVPALLKRVLRLERHAYAPELNRLHFIQGKDTIVVKVQGCTTIETALSYMVKTMSITQLDNIIYSCKVITKKDVKSQTY